MSYSIETSQLFNKEVKALSKKYPSLKNDLSKLYEGLHQNPIQGDKLGRDCYKIRLNIRSKGKGKRGGGRVITCIKIVKEKIYLLSIYDKGEKEDISEQNINNILNSLGLSG